MRFHREACVEILDRSNYPSRAAFAKTVPISPGALHDILDEPPRRQPSPEMIHKLARALKVPVTALIRDPEMAAS